MMLDNGGVESNLAVLNLAPTYGSGTGVESFLSFLVKYWPAALKIQKSRSATSNQASPKYICTTLD